VKILHYFHADWCAACRTKQPIIQDLAMQYGVPLVEHNVADPVHLRYAEQLGFRVIPAVALLEAEVPIYRAAGGLINRDALERRLTAPQPDADRHS